MPPEEQIDETKNQPGPQGQPGNNKDDDFGGDIPERWPSTWREDYAGDNEQKLDFLKRFQNPHAAIDSVFGMRQRIAQGEYVRNVSLPDNATEEQVAEWRAERGLPVAPTDYEIALPEGIEKFEDLPEVAQERLGHVREVFHQHNFTPEQAAAVLELHNELFNGQAEDEVAFDAVQRDQIEDHLRAEWGPEYRDNIALNLRFMTAEFGNEDVARAVVEARLPNDPELGDLAGLRLAEVPFFNKFLNKMARLTTDGDFLDGGDGGTGGPESRIAEIERIMATDMGKYRREGLDKEYGELMNLQERRGKLKDPNAAPEE